MSFINRQLELVTAATVWPITDAELKNHIKMDSTITADDTLITDIKKAATREAERYMNRVLISETWKMTFDGQPDPIYFPFGWLLSVESCVTVAEDDSETDEAARSIYHTQTGENGRIYLKHGYSWTTTSRDYGLLVITFKVGYDTDGAKTPKAIKDAILDLGAFLYFNRENPDQAEKKAILSLLDPWRVLRLY